MTAALVPKIVPASSSLRLFSRGKSSASRTGTEGHEVAACRRLLVCTSQRTCGGVLLAASDSATGRLTGAVARR